MWAGAAPFVLTAADARHRCYGTSPAATGAHPDCKMRRLLPASPNNPPVGQGRALHSTRWPVNLSFDAGFPPYKLS